MPSPLNPAPADLGLASPALGPWFEDAAISLGVPGDDLSVTVTPTAATKWLPPVRGILSLHFATPTRPPALAGLRAAGGGKAFTDNRLVALFRVLPEAEVRLEALGRNLPSPDGAAATTVPTRPAVRWLALEATTLSTASTAAAVIARWANGFAPDEDTPLKQLAAMGLDGTDGALTNAAKPAAVLLGPGELAGSGDALLQLDTSGYRLSAFDVRGRAIDPGAVASWWNYLATTVYTNLWAAGAASRTCPAAAARTLHLVSAHEGPVPGSLLARTMIGGAEGGATDILRPASGAAAVTVGFTAAPSLDDAPVPRAALLPHAVYAPSLSLWPSGPVAAGLERDYARVALIDVESHLTGQPRAPLSATPSGGETRRAADQNRASTRVEVARADPAASALLPDIDSAASALVALLQGPAPVTLVTPQLDRDYGPLPPLAFDTDTFPSPLLPPSVRALAGGGAASGGAVAGQRVLVEFVLGAQLDGASLRLWPDAVDLTTGRRKAADGGSGRVSNGKASLVVLLPDGADDASELGATASIAHGGASHLYGELRFTRPGAIGGTMLPWSAATGTIIACEQGAFPSPAAVSGLLPGTTLVHDDGTTASLIDPATVPDSAYATATAVRALGAGDTVRLTRPAFRSEATGSAAAALSTGGAAVTEQGREGVLRPSGPGTPLPAQAALTSVAAAADASGARAVLLPPPALARYHEIGAAQLGHPGAPATEEQAGAGVDLAGPAAILFADAASAVADAATPGFVAAAVARTASPADPAGDALWTAALRTQAAGVEGERGLDGKVLDTAAPYPFDGDGAAQRQWYADQPSITIPAPAAGQEAAQMRAMARRALVAARGAQEAAVALAAAFARAEDLVYAETPAFDLADIGSGDELIQPMQALADRLVAQPALHAVLCVPVDAFSGAPKDLARVRGDLLRTALAALASAAPGRFVSFCPSAGAGRSLRLLTTSVIVDDVWALVGSTHLSRRGLSFDASLAAAVADERNLRGRGQAPRALRRALIAARLGVAEALVPDDGPALVRTIAELTARGSTRLTIATLPPADPPVTDSDRTLWNRDGTTAPDPTDLGNWLTQLASGNLLN